MAFPLIYHYWFWNPFNSHMESFRTLEEAEQMEAELGVKVTIHDPHNRPIERNGKCAV